MRIICDTHALLFWADAPERLSDKAREAMALGRQSDTLACCDISFWEIALLFDLGRLNPQAGISPAAYMRDIVLDLNLEVLSITPEIAHLSRVGPFIHKDPADRLIAATALHYGVPLLTVDEKLRGIPGLSILW